MNTTARNVHFQATMACGPARGDGASDGERLERIFLMLLRLLLIVLVVFALLLVARLLRGAPAKRRRRP